MLPDVTETMTHDHLTSFRKILRTLHFQIQELVFLYNGSSINVQECISFNQTIDTMTSDLLHIESFSERRKIIDKFKPLFLSFQNSFDSHYSEFYNDLKSSLISITNNYANSQDSYKLPDFDLKDSLNWENFIDPIKNLSTQQDYQSTLNEIFSKGKSISQIFDAMAQLSTFYQEFPPLRTPQEIELFLLQKKNQELEKQIKELTTKTISLEKSNNRWASKYSALENDYKNMDESLKQMKACFYQVQQNLKEDQSGHENQREINVKITEEEKASLDDIKTFLSKYIKSNQGEFDYDSFVDYLSENVDDFEDVLYSLDLL